MVSQSNAKISRILLTLLMVTIMLRLVSLAATPLFDPTESRYAEIGRKMVETGNWVTPMIDYNVPFWAKPPLSFWLTASSYKLFGINEFTARLPSFMVMIAVAAMTVMLAVRHYGQEVKLLTLAVICSLPLFFYMAGGVMTDPALALATTLAMFTFWQGINRPSIYLGYGFFIALALALLAKGPIGIVLVGMPIGAWVLWHNKWALTWQRFPWITGSLLTCAIALPWYMMAEHRTPGFLHYFIVGEHWQRFLVKGWKGDLYGAGRAHARGTIWLYGLIATLPFSLALPIILGRNVYRKVLTCNDEWVHYIGLWILTPLLFFTMAQNILITYVITLLPAAALLIVHVLKSLKWETSPFLPLPFLLTPLAFTVFLLLLHTPYAGHIAKSQKPVVEAYLQLQHDTEGHLIYAEDRPYSADFYSQGKAIHAKTLEEVRQYLHTGHTNFIAITKERFALLSKMLPEELPIVAEHGNMLLLRSPE